MEKMVESIEMHFLDRFRKENHLIAFEISFFLAVAILVVQ